MNKFTKYAFRLPRLIARFSPHKHRKQPKNEKVEILSNFYEHFLRSFARKSVELSNRSLNFMFFVNFEVKLAIKSD